MVRLLTFAAVLLLLVGCANVADPEDMRAPRTDAERREFSEQAVRLNRVVQKLWPTGRALCRDESRCLTPHLGSTSRLGAFAGEGRFVISTGLMRAMATDDEIALVVAHEWAHSLLDHNSAMDVRRKELDADCLGTIIARVAGYNTHAAGAALRNILAPLERQQALAKIAGLALGVIPTRTEYPTVDEATAQISQVSTEVDRRRSIGERISKDTIREICGVSP